jgi:hypothetical protein
VHIKSTIKDHMQAILYLFELEEKGFNP